MASEKMVVQFQPYGSLPVLFMEKIVYKSLYMIGHVFFIITDCNTDQCATSSSLYRQRQKFIFCRCHRQIFYCSLSKMPKQFDCCEMFICCCEMHYNEAKGFTAAESFSNHRSNFVEIYSYF